MARIQVTVDSELARVLEEFGTDLPRSKVIRDLAIRGAEASRRDRDDQDRAIRTLTRIASGEDNDFDFGVSEQLHRERR